MCERVCEKAGEREGERECTHTFSVARTNVCTHANSSVFEIVIQPKGQTDHSWDHEKKNVFEFPTSNSVTLLTLKPDDLKHLNICTNNDYFDMYLTVTGQNYDINRL